MPGAGCTTETDAGAGYLNGKPCNDDHHYRPFRIRAGPPSGVSGKFILGAGSIALGIPLMIWWNLRRSGREYFCGRTMACADEIVRESERAQAPPERAQLAG